MSKQIYTYHPTTGESLERATAEESPLEPGVYLLPAFATDVAPPATGQREVAVFENGGWQKKTDWREVPLYSTTDGSPVNIEAIGQTPADVGATDKAPTDSTHSWVNGAWVPDSAKVAAALAAAKTQAKQAIDAAAAAVYNRFTPYLQEYTLREEQATAFKNAGYTGATPQQVAAYATPIGLTPQDATDTILAQASTLRLALAQIGVLRMRKNEVNTKTTLAEVDAVAASVCQSIETINGQI